MLYFTQSVNPPTYYATKKVQKFIIITVLTHLVFHALSYPASTPFAFYHRFFLYASKYRNNSLTMYKIKRKNVADIVT